MASEKFTDSQLDVLVESTPFLQSKHTYKAVKHVVKVRKVLKWAAPLLLLLTVLGAYTYWGSWPAYVFGAVLVGALYYYDQMTRYMPFKVAASNRDMERTERKYDALCETSKKAHDKIRNLEPKIGKMNQTLDTLVKALVSVHSYRMDLVTNIPPTAMTGQQLSFAFLLWQSQQQKTPQVVDIPWLRLVFQVGDEEHVLFLDDHLDLPIVAWLLSQQLTFVATNPDPKPRFVPYSTEETVKQVLHDQISEMLGKEFRLPPPGHQYQYTSPNFIIKDPKTDASIS